MFRPSPVKVHCSLSAKRRNSTLASRNRIESGSDEKRKTSFECLSHKCCRFLAHRAISDIICDISLAKHQIGLDSRYSAGLARTPESRIEVGALLFQPIQPEFRTKIKKTRNKTAVGRKGKKEEKKERERERRKAQI